MSVEEYLKLGAPPEKQVEEAEKTKDNIIVDHKPAPKKRGVKPEGGGVTMKGDFGDPPKV